MGKRDASKIEDIIRSIQLNTRSGYITQDVLEGRCGCSKDMIKALLEGGFLGKEEDGRYPVKKELLDYDPALAGYRNFVLNQWGSIESLI